MILESIDTLLALTCVFGFIMAWGIGANDVANAMGTSVGSKSLTIRQAIIIAIIFECAGALLAGGDVTQTIQKGIITLSGEELNSLNFVYGMLASLLAGGIWLAVASYFGWPVSTTHTIVGAIVGFGVVSLGVDAVQWSVIGSIVASWVLSPILGGILGYLLFFSVQMSILRHRDPFHRAKLIVPIYIFFVAMIILALVLYKGLDNLGLSISPLQQITLLLGLSTVCSLIGVFLIHRIPFEPNQSRRFSYYSVEKIFGVLMLFTACAMAFAHGSNDVANAIGPVAAIVEILKSGQLSETAVIPLWVMGLGTAGIGFGLVTYGYKVISTVGSGITELTPSKGFAATLGAAATVVLASGTGLPISTTHTLVGAILGVGLARGIGALNLDTIRRIFLSWVITLPAGACLAIVSYQILKWVL